MLITLKCITATGIVRKKIMYILNSTAEVTQEYSLLIASIISNGSINLVMLLCK